MPCNLPGNARQLQGASKGTPDGLRSAQACRAVSSVRREPDRYGAESWAPLHNRRGNPHALCHDPRRGQARYSRMTSSSRLVAPWGQSRPNELGGGLKRRFPCLPRRSSGEAPERSRGRGIGAGEAPALDAGTEPNKDSAVFQNRKPHFLFFVSCRCILLWIGPAPGGGSVSCRFRKRSTATSSI